MSYGPTRRELLKITPFVFSVGATKLPSRAAESGPSARGNQQKNGQQNDGPLVSATFPAQPAELVREMVTVAHFDLNRVRALVDAHPSLAIAAWDWGFGDWETPLGAASHMGNRPIAEYLLSKGAPTSLFSAAMFGQLGVIKPLVTAQPGIQHIRGPHSISLLAHARMGGEAARPVFEFLESLHDADSEPPVPLSDKDAAALAGTYSIGAGDTDQVDVNADMKMYVGNKMYTYPPQLNWTRKGTMSRPLFHLGDRMFYPAGAAAVRIHFTEDAGAAVMTVTDGPLVLTARREQESK
jgi:hypothetical protein